MSSKPLIHFSLTFRSGLTQNQTQALMALTLKSAALCRLQMAVNWTITLTCMSCTFLMSSTTASWSS